MADGTPSVGLDVRVRSPIVLSCFALSGAASLTYEVVWTRALSVVLGSTTYAISSMLATFMLGLAVGGIVGGRLADGRRNPVRALAFTEVGIGLLGITSHAVIEGLPAAYLSLYRAFHLSAPAYFAAQVGLCSLVMLAPTILMGLTFPLVARAVVGRVEEVGQTVGLAYGVNTIGAVAGSLFAGFLLIPMLGLRGATLVAAGANATAAVVLLASARRAGPAVALILLAYLAAGGWLSSAEQGARLVNFYSAHHFMDGPGYGHLASERDFGMRRLYERDGVDGYVAAYRDRTGHLLVQVGGKIEGTTEQDLANTELLSYLPVAAHRSPRTMLVIGLGAGTTLDVARRVVPSVDLVEINAGVLEVVAAHGPRGVLDGTRVFRDDARNLLLRTEERWDVISSEPSYPTDYAVANLFSQEFYRLAASRLAEGGVFCQWLPYYLLTNDDVTMMVKTFASAFSHVTLWKVKGSMDLLLLGSDSPFVRHARAIKERVEAISAGEALGYDLSRDEVAVEQIAALAGVPINTDDRPRLEFAVARNLRVGDLSLLER